MPKLRSLLLVLALVIVATGASPPAPRPYVYRVLRHQVTDGDTIRTELDLGFRIRVDYAARLHGLDTPELSTLAGREVRKFTEAWCAAQQTLLAVSVTKDKYEGRYVAEIHGDHEQLNELLLAKKFAKPYDGGRKPVWTEEEQRAITQSARAAVLDIEIQLKQRGGPNPPPKLTATAEKDLFSPAEPAVELAIPLAPTTARNSLTPDPRPRTPSLTHWLTSSSGVRHNSSCQHYQTSKGRACSASEGKACKKCGG